MQGLLNKTSFCKNHFAPFARVKVSSYASHRLQSSNQRLKTSRTSRHQKFSQTCRSAAESETDVQTEGSDGSLKEVREERREPSQKIDKEVARFATKAATTFAPRASGASKNPAYKGSLLYTIFEVQAWLFLVIGGLLSFNIIFPSDQPNIARLLGMWSIWMFTIPALRARDCSAAEKEALNYLFLLVPILNVSLPFVWKSFPFIYSADVVTLAALYAWKVGLSGGEEKA